MHYWSARLACPLDPLINREFNRQNLGAQIANNATAGSGGLFNLVWSVLSNLRFDAYIDAAAPQVFPMSRWLVAGRVSADEMQGWRGGMTVIWALAGAAGLTAALAALWQQGRRKVLACDAAMALILLGVAAMWCASQFVRHDYEVSFELPLLILAIVMGLASPHGLDRLKRAAGAGHGAGAADDPVAGAGGRALWAADGRCAGFPRLSAAAALFGAAAGAGAFERRHSGRGGALRPVSGAAGAQSADR
jgi:hypothetical protein